MSALGSREPCRTSGPVKQLYLTNSKYRREKNLSVRVLMHPVILARLKNEDGALINELEQQFKQLLTFRADPALHHESFKVVDPDTSVEF